MEKRTVTTTSSTPRRRNRKESREPERSRHLSSQRTFARICILLTNTMTISSLSLSTRRSAALDSAGPCQRPRWKLVFNLAMMSLVCMMVWGSVRATSETS